MHLLYYARTSNICCISSFLAVEPFHPHTQMRKNFSRRIVCFAVEDAFWTSARTDYLRVRHTCHTIFLYHVKDLNICRWCSARFWCFSEILAKTSPSDLSDGNAFAILTDACLSHQCDRKSNTRNCSLLASFCLIACAHVIPMTMLNIPVQGGASACNASAI